MSYDLIIRGDDDYSKYTGLEDLESFIENLPQIIPNGERGVCYQDGDDYHMEIDLDLVSDEGDIIADGADSTIDKINCIEAHIPYAFLNEKVDFNRYAEILVQIAEHLKWQLYDPQKDEYM